jgi:hypothetical protein
MEYGLLTLIALVLGGGMAGGLLSAIGYHRRLLVLEESIQVYRTAVNDRLNELERITTRDIKREAANVKWGKKNATDEALAETLLKANAGRTTAPHAWDPRTWGQGGP